MLWIGAVVIISLPLLLILCGSKKDAGRSSKRSRGMPHNPLQSNRSVSEMQPKELKPPNKETSEKQENEPPLLKFIEIKQADEEEAPLTNLVSVDDQDNPLNRPDVKMKMRNHQMKPSKERKSLNMKTEATVETQMKPVDAVDRTQDEMSGKGIDDGMTEVTVALDRECNVAGGGNRYKTKKEKKTTASKDGKKVPEAGKKDSGVDPCFSTFKSQSLYPQPTQDTFQMKEMETKTQMDKTTMTVLKTLVLTQRDASREPLPKQKKDKKASMIDSEKDGSN